MMNILITGGAGFIGYHTVNALIDAGHSVRVMDNLLPQVHTDPSASVKRLHSSVNFVNGDIRNRSDLMQALHDIDVVYHLAAETGVGQSMFEIERYVDVNIRGTAILCECIAHQEKKIDKLVLASSRAVYGEGSYTCIQCGGVFPKTSRSLKDLRAKQWDIVCKNCDGILHSRKTNEDAPRHPVSIYGLTKQVQEQLVINLFHTHEIPSIIFRYFNVIGPGQCLSNPYTGIVTIFCNRFLTNKEVEIYEDGAMLRDFIDVRDIAIINTKAVDVDISEPVIMNVGSGEALSVLELAKRLKTITGGSSQIKISGRYRIGDIRHCAADNSKVDKLIKHTMKFSVQESLEDFVNWAKRSEHQYS